jgi:hypothetical protein
MAVKHASYGPKAAALLAVDMTDANNPEEVVQKLEFHQATSLRLINELRYTGAARAVVKVILTPAKAQIRAVANKSIMLMPKEAEPLLIGALNGSDAELAKLGEAFPEKGYLQTLTQVLGQISRPAGREAAIAALPKAASDGQRAEMAQSLVSYPADKRSVETFMGVYSKIPAGAKMGPINAHAALTQASASFYDKNITLWLLKEVAASKGDEAVEMHGVALASAIKLMGVEHLTEVSKSVAKFGTKTETEMYAAAQKVVAQCKEDAGCYVTQLKLPIPAAPPTAKFSAVKACWMAAMFGNEKTGAELVALVPTITDSTVRLSLLSAIDHLFPKGDEASAKALEKIVEAKKNPDTDNILANIAYKLRARSLP